MKNIPHLMLLIFILSMFVQDTHGVSNKNDPNHPPVVYSEAKFDVSIEEGIVYAEGLSHEDINSEISTIVPLTLDLYIPENNIKNRPVVMLIHGGSFSGGSSKYNGLVEMAKYFAQRGWVAISINYRLKRDVGTVPQEWVDEYSELNPYYRFRFLSVYPAIRDAKAAVRWVVGNADKYHMNTDHITVGGGSAGAVIAIALGVTNEEDYRDELRLTQDPTLATTNIDKSYQIKTILNFWGHKKAVEFLEIVYGHRRFDSTDAPILIAHGTDDSVIPLRRAKELRAIYEHHGAPYVYYSLEGYGHSAWDAIVDGKSLGDLSLEFMVEQQALTLKTDQ